MNALSVVIPTYNRCDILAKALSSYLRQQDSAGIAEILVIDDGSTDATPTVIAQIAKNSSVRIRHIRQDNKGPATARNAGIREAAGDLILFTDDDIVPSPALVSEHLEWHKRFPESSAAVLGRVSWAPEVNPTPFMDWYGGNGPLFGFALLEDRVEIPYRFFYTCNVSVKTEFLRKHGSFDEDFKIAAYEDIELGFRLNKAGMTLRYNRGALAYHRQYISFADACRRYKKTRSAAEVLKQKEAGRHYPGPPTLTQQVTTRVLKWSAPVLSPLKGLMDSRVPLPWTVYRAMFGAFRT